MQILTRAQNKKHPEVIHYVTTSSSQMLAILIFRRCICIRYGYKVIGFPLFSCNLENILKSFFSDIVITRDYDVVCYVLYKGRSNINIIAYSSLINLSFAYMGSAWGARVSTDWPRRRVLLYSHFSCTNWLCFVFNNNDTVGERCVVVFALYVLHKIMFLLLLLCRSAHKIKKTN